MKALNRSTYRKITKTIVTLSMMILLSSGALAQADLRIYGSIESSDRIAQAGDRVSLDYTISNRGNYEVDDPLVAFFLSTDPIIDQDDIFLEAEDNSDLDPYESDDEGEQVPLPYGIAPGNYYIIFVIDPYDHVSERIETNNTSAAPITIQ